MAQNTVMQRPAKSTGHAGRPVELQANYFGMRFQGLDAIFQYDVSLLVDKKAPGAVPGAEPVPTDVAAERRTPITVNRAVFAQFKAEKDLIIAYDGRKIAYAATDIADCEGQYTCDRDGKAAAEAAERVEVYTVQFVKAAALDHATLMAVLSGQAESLGEGVQPIINALDVVLGDGNTSRLVEVGRSFYSNVDAVDLGGGASAWRGFYQSIRLAAGGLLVNVDLSFTSFWQARPLVEMCQRVNYGRLPADFPSWRKTGKELHGLKTQASHTGMYFRVYGFSSKAANELTFTGDDGVSLTVAAYLEQKYGVRLQSPSLPCVRTSLKKDIWVPIELLTVCENQRRTKALTSEQTTKMIQTAALRPTDRQRSAASSISDAEYNSDATCHAFGMSVDPQMKKFTARVLEPPRVLYRDNKAVQPRNGQWRMEKRENMMLQWSRGLYYVTFVQIGSNLWRGAESYNNVVQQFVNVAYRSGIPVGNTAPEQLTFDSYLPPEAFEKFLVDAINDRNRAIKSISGQENHRLQLLVVIMEKQSPTFYPAMKRVCDVQMGVASQCMLSSTILRQRGLDLYMGNVLLKVNAKIGGHNFKPQESADPRLNPKFIHTPHIVLGADVSHANPGSNKPSIAAVVGSFDPDGMQYTGTLSNQPSRQEMIDNMGAMFLSVYKKWFDFRKNPQTGTGPHAQSIIMFRDGVSEGEYEHVLEVELPAIRRVCRDQLSFNPLITFIVVTKRHHSRFFGASNSVVDDKGNVVPGTVIDTDVTSSERWDFYLNSHKGIQGTNKPSKYTVLVDENKMTADQLQSYIFRLSHGYARCTKSVSMVNAAYYAHLLAFRGRCWLGEEGSDDMSMSSGGIEQVPVADKVHDNLANCLFFV